MKSTGNISLLVILALCAGAGGWYAVNRAKAATNSSTAGAPPPPPPVPVSAVAVGKKDVPTYLDGLGTVQAYNSVTVRSQIDGEIVNIAFKEGQDVKKGDLLVQIDPLPYEAQLEQAQAKKLQDQARIPQDEAKISQDKAKVLQDQAKKEQDEANLANARVNLQRLEDAVKANAVTQQSVDDQRTLTIALQAARAGDDAAILGDQAAIKSDEAAVEADKATVQADEAAIKFAKTQLAYTVIHSPIDGRVGIRFVDVGNVVRMTDPNGIVLVTQIQPISVLFTLPQTDLIKINARMAVEKLPVLAMDSTGKHQLDSGVLELVDNTIDQATGTIRLKATFQNGARKLWPGGFVNTRLHLDTLHDAIVVDEPAVQHGPDGTYVFAVKPDQTVEIRKVKVMLNQDGQAVLSKGVEAGELVVLTGQERLKPGAHVAVNQPNSSTAEEKGGAKETSKPAEKEQPAASKGSGPDK